MLMHVISEIRGIDAVVRALEKNLGEQKMNRVVNKVMKEVGQEAEDGLKEAVSVFKDTGKTVEETTYSLSNAGGRKQVKLGWGKGTRWRLEHLNEWGYTREGRKIITRGFGVVQKYVDGLEGSYQTDVRKRLMEELKL
jgi:hypothetical protein